MKITSLVKINDGWIVYVSVSILLSGTLLVFTGIHWYSLVFTGQ